MTKVIIVVEGGNVQEVLTDDSLLEVGLVDYDNEANVQRPVYFSSLDSAKINSISDNS